MAKIIIPNNKINESAVQKLHAETICPVCDGSGEVECPECGGSGEIESGHGSVGTVICPVCDGSGEVECDNCDGDGCILTMENIKGELVDKFLNEEKWQQKIFKKTKETGKFCEKRNEH